MSNILVIGNGFDLALGLPTKYEDFVNSAYWPIKDLDSEHFGEENLYNFLHKYTENHRDSLGKVRWIDLEEALKEYAKSKVFDYPLSDYEKDIIEYDKKIFKKLKTHFGKYLNNVAWKYVTKRCDICEPVTSVMKTLAQSKSFENVYSFNYTDTQCILDFLYGWNPEVIHLHGRVRATESNIVLGIGENKGIAKEYRFMVKSYSDAFMKHDLKDDLYKAEKIVFYGLSMGSADFIYFKRFFVDSVNNYKSGMPKKDVFFFTYNETSRQAIMDSLVDAGLEMEEVYSCMNLYFLKCDEYRQSKEGDRKYKQFEEIVLNQP